MGRFEVAHRVFDLGPHRVAIRSRQVGHHGIECTECFSCDSNVLGGTGRPVRDRHGVNLGVGKAGLTKDIFKHPGAAQAEGPRLSLSGG